MFRMNFFTNVTQNVYTLGYGYYYSASGTTNPDITNSVTNGTPFVAKAMFKAGEQTISVREAGDTVYKTYSTTWTKTVTSTLNMYIFAANSDGTVAQKAPAGTRLYYCRIYSDETYTTLVFDGVPCYYNDEYGLWDKVSNTFFGAVSGSGTFSGPSNS